MSDAGESGDINESFVEYKYKIDIEETSINLDCVKNEPNKEAHDFIEDSHPTRYTITLEYENLLGEPSQQRKIEEDCDNLIGFLDNDVMMESTMIKLEVIKEEDDGSFINFHCSKCKGIYNGYCLKCSTLLYILNNNFVGSESNTTPTDILEIRENSRGKGVYLLRTLPINVIFGPFEGISGIESTVGHCWKIIDNKLRNIKSGNWMKDIVCASSALLKNVNIFQIDGNLYFQTNREITEGEELLIYYNDDELQQLDNSKECLYTPQKLDKLPKIFACTICCLGFGSNKCLMEHKGRCRVEQSRGMNDFVLIECHYCKMWMEKWEHEEHHIAYCLEKHHRMSTEYSEAVERNDANVEGMGDGDCGTRAGKRRYRGDICSRRKDRRNIYSGGNREDRLNESALAGRSNNEQIQNTIETNKKSRLQQNHLKKHRSIKPFKCDICMVTFTTKDCLKLHIKNKHTVDGGVKDYKCSECSYQTYRKGDFQRHLNKHKGIKPFECDICAMKFTLKGSLNTHIKNKHAANASAKDYKCLECSFQTNYKSHIQSHLNQHTGIIPFQCDICLKEFTEKGNLRIHIRNKHAVDGSSKDYKCSECFYRTNQKYHFQRHLNKHRGIKPFKCDICMMIFIRKGYLKMHIRNKHTNDVNGKDYKCSECSYQTIDRSNFRKHLNEHKGIKPFTCDICMKEFSQKGHLKMHIKNKHTGGGGVKDYKCSECTYQTNHKGNLQIHLNKHKSIKLFQCDICAMKFSTKQHLKRHIKNRHTDVGDVRDYKCLECTFQTNYKANFQMHLNKHAHSKPFTCDICMMKFSLKDLLKLHIKNKHRNDGGVKDYKCLECSYQTNVISHFHTHLNKHRGITFTCDICMKEFSRKGNLARHINTKHAKG